MSSEASCSSTLTGQQDATAFFRQAIANDRLAHAYLFLGPAGVGKADFATELAKYLFCLNRRQTTGPVEGFGNCGTCRNCRRISHGNFPDLHRVERLKDKRDITKDVVERLQRELSFKPVEGPYKVFLIMEADRLNRSTSNRLLKVLEEPPGHSLIILLAEEQDDFLPTILSRVQVIRFRAMAEDELSGLLSCQLKLEADQARFLSRVSGGSPGRARELHQLGFCELHEWLHQRVKKMSPEENFEIAEELRKRMSERVSSVRDERELLHVHLDGLMLRVRDQLEEVCNSPTQDRASGRLQRQLEAILRAVEAIDANGNIRLTLENLFFEVAVAGT